MAKVKKWSVGEIKGLLTQAKIPFDNASKLMGLSDDDLARLDNASILSLDMVQALDQHYGLEITGLGKPNSTGAGNGVQPTERLRQVREELSLNQSEFGEAIGLTQAGVSKFEMGLIPLRKLVLLAIEHVYGIRREWLVYGEEPKYLSKKTLKNEEVEILDVAAKLNRDDRKIWLELGKYLANIRWDGKIERRRKASLDKKLA